MADAAAASPPPPGAPKTPGSTGSVSSRVPATYEEIPKEELLLHMRRTSCTKPVGDDYEYPKVKTECGPMALGILTRSVGIQLYFQFLAGLGWTFVVMFILVIPMLVCCLSGNMVDSSNPLNQALAMTTVANIGRCPSSGCESSADYSERCLWDGDCDADGTLLREWTPYLGVADSLGILVFIAFGIVFSRWWIPKVTEQFDADTIAPGDFTICISNPPQHLGDHHPNYEAALRAHFVKVLQNMQQDPVPDASDACIKKVTLARQYNGAIFNFINKGRLLEELHNHEARRDKHGQDTSLSTQQRIKRMSAADKAIAKANSQIFKYDAHLTREGKRIDQEREVCRAFVTFNTPGLKDKILWEYRYSNFAVFRLFQSQQLRFHGAKIRITKAVEPSDLYWENMDFPWLNKLCRQITVLIVTIVILLVTSFGLVFAESFFDTVNSTTDMYDTWVIQATSGSSSQGKCFNVVDWELLESCTLSSSSRDWPITEIYDLEHVVAEDVKGDYWETATNRWNSSTCGSSTSSSIDEDWLAVHFDRERSVKCMNFAQGVDNTESELRVWACQDKDLPGVGNRSSWTPSSSCLAMQVIDISTGTVSNGARTSAKLQVARDIDCSAELSFEAAVQASERGDDDSVNCYCQQEASRSPGITAPPYDTEVKKLCKDWSMSKIKLYGAMACSVISVCVINQILLLIFSFLVAFTRPQTNTETTVVQLVLLFFAQFINTALLMYLVNARFPNVPSLLSFIGNGDYYEVTAGWYTVVGASLTITICSQVLSNTVPQLLMAKCYPHIRPFTIWWSGAVTRASLEKQYELPNWELSLRAAQTFNVVCTIIFYSGGMPVLYFAGAVYAFVAYWVDKYSLVRGSKRPPAYDATVMQTCMNFIPFAVVLHSCFASFVFGSQLLFPSDFNQYTLPFAEALVGISEEEALAREDAWISASAADKETGTLFEEYMQAKLLGFSRTACSPLLIIFVVGVVYYLISYIHKLLLAPVMAPFLAAAKDFILRTFPRLKKRAASRHDLSIEWDVAVESFFKRNNLLYSYDMKDHSDYTSASEAILHSAEQEVARREVEKAKDSPSALKETAKAAEQPVPSPAV
mmetsp:Transcript_25023/g.54436  ORF Transcript_25023/g.54436 Transcript_25023/m.54436 type:complete len:1094 (+) Transcript_25023:67-3348(+)